MFTGIIEEVGIIRRITTGSLEIKAHTVLDGTKPGDSIAVNGVCLTVTKLMSDGFTADVMPETMRCTAFDVLKIGSSVNLERALTLASRLGGHIVSGHIDGIGTISGLNDEGNAVLLTVTAEKEIMRYIVTKGSVAIDGISLTVAQTNEKSFTLSLIPHTREVTALKNKKIGDRLNIETDIIGRYVEKLLTSKEEIDVKPVITREFLMKYGF